MAFWRFAKNIIYLKHDLVLAIVAGSSTIAPPVAIISLASSVVVGIAYTASRRR